jgi:predicted unusual protein kinase regulating ubiquinone biosynthesis (AarF/ABC1/UbiB family)
MMEEVRGDMDMGEMLVKCFELMRRCRVKMQGDFVNVCIACILCEGVGRGLDKSIDLLVESGHILQTQVFRDLKKRSKEWL